MGRKRRTERPLKEVDILFGCCDPRINYETVTAYLMQLFGLVQVPAQGVSGKVIYQLLNPGGSSVVHLCAMLLTFKRILKEHRHHAVRVKKIFMVSHHGDTDHGRADCAAERGNTKIEYEDSLWLIMALYKTMHRVYPKRFADYPEIWILSVNTVSSLPDPDTVPSKLSLTKGVWNAVKPFDRSKKGQKNRILDILHIPKLPKKRKRKKT